MTINHHLDPATIVSFAAGTLDQAFGTAAAAHVAWCPQCRAAAQQAEAAGGILLAGLDASQVSPDCKRRTLELLDRATLHRFPNAPRDRPRVPAPLAQLLATDDLESLKWRRMAPGVTKFDIPLEAASRGHLRLMRIGAGCRMPEHGHGGEEITLILSGAYHDKLGRFAPGDVADLDEDIEHQPVVEREADCICLVATEAPARFKSWPARLLQPFIGV